MILSQPQHNHHCYPSSSTIKPTHFFCLSTSTPPTNHRTHNSKSTHLLIHHLNPLQEPSFKPPHEEKRPRKELVDFSLARKRTPQFPGSIHPNEPNVDDMDASSSLSPIRKLLKDGGDELDEEMLVKAVEIRRNVIVEIFVEAMIKGKFGITYATNLASRLSDFVDFVMIQAASLKILPEFSGSSFNFRVKDVIDSSGVVPLIRWLKHNELPYPSIGKLICKSRGNLDSIRRTAEWLKTIHVKGRSIGIVMVRAGEDILERSTEEMDEIVGYLESKGLRRIWMGYVMSRCPELLCMNMEEVRIRSEFYLDMGMNEHDFGTMVYDFPKVLGYLSLEEMNQKVAYLKEFGLTSEEVGRLLAFKPHLMGCSIEERWKPLVKYLYYHGVSRDGMKRILTTKPILFCIDLESNIVPKVQFLRDIGVQDDAIGNVLVKFPHLLTYSLYKKIRPVVIFLLTKAGVTQKDIGKVIALGPELLGCSISKKLDPNVKYFLSLGIRLKVLGEMIADFPMLLRYNTDVLRPKYQYLRRTMVRPLNDLIEFPRFFSYSLEGRIIPRHKIMVENRLNFKLRYMLESDTEFDKRVQAAIEKRRKFELGITNAADSVSQVEGYRDDIPVDACDQNYLSSDSETIAQTM
ncbi:transcription termination factor MTERF2, chloroplastic [Heracleum sosnowskyi]|uniref:Transcription termination factor MTERF2, chloroplastic n=1 Tax=Heracleum sosnowskyi TaxID=360622 RepID=A0AAD8IZS5_9APIA|nr:transcription termination factor MTERF2, chloroplastic [Heracleum sosnowskyi]